MNTNRTIDNAIKLVILNQKREAYLQQYYNLTLEAEIASELSDTKLAERIRKKMLDNKQVVKFLEKKIEELEKEVEDFVSES